MPKKESQNDRAKKYFKLHNNDEKTYICSIEGCAKIIHGNNPSSFVSHIKHIHKSIYRMEINQEAVDEKTIQLKRLQLIQHCAEIVSVNGRPLNYLRDSGFQNIIADQTDFLNANKSGINFHTLTEIKQYLFDSEKKNAWNNEERSSRSICFTDDRYRKQEQCVTFEHLHAIHHRGPNPDSKYRNGAIT